MSRIRTSVNFDVAVLLRLDRYATQHGVSRSAALNTLIVKGLDHDERAVDVQTPGNGAS